MTNEEKLQLIKKNIIDLRDSKIDNYDGSEFAQGELHMIGRVRNIVNSIIDRPTTSDANEIINYE